MELVQTSKKYKSTHSLVYSCHYHVIFCPKYCRKVLVDGIDTRLKALIPEKQGDYGYEVLDMEVMPDPVHLLLDIDP
jgi:putative transposase